MKGLLPLVFLASLPPAFVTTVQDLGSVASAIQHPGGRQIFAEQTAGATSAKGSGEFPQGLSKKQWITRVAPNEGPDNLALTSVKFRGKDGKYTDIACFADNRADAEQVKKYMDNTCPESYSNGCADKLYLGTFSWQNPQLMLIICSEKLLNQLSEWNKVVERESDDESVRLLVYYTKLDLASYRIAPDILAFEVRSGCSDVYSGGGAFHEVLEPYTIRDSKIINVFSDFVYYYPDIAGDWNEDGAGQYDINEGKYILKIRLAKMHGFHDLKRVSLQDKSSQIFRWSESLQRYTP